MQNHRSPSNFRRVSLTVAQVLGATAAATITAGAAAAESLSREDGGRNSGGRDTSRTAPDRSTPLNMGGTGMHAIDPNGYHHTDSNPLLRNQHQQYLRDMRATPQEPPRNPTDSAALTTWNSVENPDGSWTVCRPQASWC